MLMQHQVFDDLKRELSRIYSDLERVTGVAKSAGLDPAVIKYDPTPLNYWENILDEAEKQQLIEALLDVASEEYPRDRDLQEVRKLYRDWVSAGRPELAEVAEAYNSLSSCAQHIPVVDDFIGRDQYLEYYQDSLHKEGFAIITGMEGIGKTYLGAKLARGVATSEEEIFWFKFDRITNNTSEKLLLALAAFLFCRGWSDPWTYFKGEITTHKNLELPSKLTLLLKGLKNGNYVICLDNLEVAKEEFEIVEIFNFIQAQGGNGAGELPARFIIIGSELPHEMEYLVSQPLRGFSEADAKVFIEANGVNLLDDFIHRLWELTEGNPMLLRLSISLIQAKKGEYLDIDKFLEQMAEESNVRNFLMHKILSRLPPEDHNTMNALSIFPSAIERETASEILSIIGIRDAYERINSLVDKWILGESVDGFLQFHRLVREFCYRNLEPIEEKEKFNRCAAGYFEKEKKDYLSAGYHYLESDDYGQALECLTGHVKEIVNAGGASALQEQLARFRLSDLTLKQKAAINQARGDAFSMEGKYQQALEAYEEALQRISENKDHAQLLFRMGNALYLSGNYQEAIKKLTKSMGLFDEQDLTSKSNNQCTIGWACYRLGQLKKAEHHFDQCYKSGIKLGDDILMARAGLGLGLLAWRKEELQKARGLFDRCYDIFRNYGDRVGEIRALINLGLVDSQRGDLYQESKRYLEAKKIAEQVGDVDNLRLIYNNLGNLHQLLDKYDQAVIFYRQLEELARNTGHKPMVSTAAIGQADAYLAARDYSKAQACALEAFRVAKEIGKSVELAASYRVFGDIRLAQGSAKKSKSWFERSVLMLQEVEDKEEMAKARHGLDLARSSLTTAI